MLTTFILLSVHDIPSLDSTETLENDEDVEKRVYANISNFNVSRDTDLPSAIVILAQMM